jgi:hypothetical protein
LVDFPGPKTRFALGGGLSHLSLTSVNAILSTANRMGYVSFGQKVCFDGCAQSSSWASDIDRSDEASLMFLGLLMTLGMSHVIMTGDSSIKALSIARSVSSHPVMKVPSVQSNCNLRDSKRTVLIDPGKASAICSEKWHEAGITMYDP